jgi:hypothetical protein
MKSRITILLACAALPFTASAASAQDSSGNASVGVTAGTLGIGPEAGYRFNERFGVRANATFLSVSHDFDSDDVNYEGKINLKSFGAVLDFYPFGGGFRVSAGARINGNKARLTATPTGDTEVGDEVYTAAQIGTITGRADVKDFAPQLTIGYGGGLSSGLSFGIEAGALFQGGIRIREFTSNGTLANDADFRAELENERRELQDDVNGYKVYPIVQLGAKYRF